MQAQQREFLRRGELLDGKGQLPVLFPRAEGTAGGHDAVQALHVQLPEVQSRQVHAQLPLLPGSVRLPGDAPVRLAVGDVQVGVFLAGGAGRPPLAAAHAEDHLRVSQRPTGGDAEA